MCLKEFIIIKTIETFENHKPIINYKLVIDSSGSYLAVASEDKMLRIRKFNSGKTIATAYSSSIN